MHQPFDCKLLYYARHAMAKEKEDQSGAKWESDLDKFLQECDVVSINVPLSDKTRWVSYSPKQKNVAIFFVHHL